MDTGVVPSANGMGDVVLEDEDVTDDTVLREREGDKDTDGDPGDEVVDGVPSSVSDSVVLLPRSCSEFDSKEYSIFRLTSRGLLLSFNSSSTYDDRRYLYSSGTHCLILCSSSRSLCCSGVGFSRRSLSIS
jgi:hypothetical protein